MSNNEREYFCVNYTGRKGGGPLDAIEMTKGLINNNVSVIAIISENIENRKDWDKLPIDVIAIKGNRSVPFIMFSYIFFSVLIAPQIKQRIKQYNVRYIYVPMGSMWTHKINSLFKNAIKMKMIHDPVAHSGEERMAKLNKLAGDNNNCYDILGVHTEKFKDFIAEKYKLPTYYVPLGRHDMYKWCENKVNTVKYDKDKVNFLFFGRISKYKGLEIIAEAYREISLLNPEKYSLTIVGSGDFTPYSEEYKELPNVTIINRWIKDEEVESCFTGENIILLCPYHDASQSGVVFVALDYGVPLIVSDVGGMSDQVVDHETAIVIKPGDAQALKEAMILLANDRELRETISYNQKKSIENYTWDNSAKVVIKAMKENSLRKK